jgi:ferrous iron transport protein A
MNTDPKKEKAENTMEIQKKEILMERVSLGEIKPGRTVKLVAVEGGGSLQSRLASLGLIPGAQIEMVRNSAKGPFVVAVRGSRLALGRGLARHLVVI